MFGLQLLIRRLFRIAARGGWALGSVLLCIVLLEAARRRQLFGLPWADQMPDGEVLWLRGILVFTTALFVSLGNDVLTDALVGQLRRSRVLIGLRFALATMFVTLLVRFFQPHVSEALAPLLILGRLISFVGVLFFFAELFRVYDDVRTRLSREEHLTANLYQRTTTDPVTGLPNRFLFNDRLSNAIERSKRSTGTLAVFYVTLDRYQIVFDSLGDATGDEVVRAAAERLSNCLRRSDTVCRVEGGEFLAMAGDLAAPSSDARMLCERILEEVARPIRVKDRELMLTASVGVALCPTDGMDVDTLVKNADRAMSRAKERGHNQYVYYQADLSDTSVGHFVLENELRQAIQKDQLVVHYQPKIDARTGTITGAEALVRWKHPERGLVSPADFIPVAEETRLIIPIDRHVLKRACAQMRAWHLMGHRHLKIAVNLSARQFQTDDLPAAVAQVLSETQLPGEALELEITESTVMQNTDAALRILEQLKLLGVTVSIDDFGTGYSSLGYLRKFPVDCLKIDRTLISNGDPATPEASIAQAIVALGRSFGLEIVAEGVETERQRDFLCSIGCDALQGFLFSRPVEQAAFELLLKGAGPYFRVALLDPEQVIDRSKN